MKGDFSRNTFDSRKHYTGVRMQQGRVQLDADWNEQQDIAAYVRSTALTDLLGGSGAPQDGGGFAVKVTGGELVLSPGRYYVRGLLCENDASAEIQLDTQPDLPGVTIPTVPDPPDYPAAWYLVYLDAWERHVTALEDPDLFELALGGPDTATRTRLIWQVRLQRLTDTPPSSWRMPLGWEPTAGAQVLPPSTTALNPLRPQLEARSVATPRQNQLYRVEVHQAGRRDGGATFKWSRDNGVVAARINKPSQLTIEINRQIGQAPGGGFAAGQWIEVLDEAGLLQGRPGVFARLATVEGQVLTVEGWPGPADPVPDLPNGGVIRRWDSEAASAVTLPGTNDGYLALEDGLEIRFGGDALAPYRTGDYWLIPIRAAAGVLWPTSSAGVPVLEPPNGIAHSYAALAFAQLAVGGWDPTVVSLRSVFVGTTQIPGPEKLNRTVDDTMTASLVITGDLSVQRKVTVGQSTATGGSLELRQAPLLPATGNQIDRGVRFPALGTGDSAYLRYFTDGAQRRLVLGVEGGAVLSLRESGQNRLTIDGSRIGIGTATPAANTILHVVGPTRLESGAGGRVEILGALTVRDGTERDGRVLTVDALGQASWKDLPIRLLGVPVFLANAYLVSSGGAVTDWTTHQIPADKVPATASGVILDYQIAMAGPDDGDVDATLEIRRSSADAALTLARCRSAGDGDNIAWGGQGIFPLQNGSFQWTITYPGFDGGHQLRVIGYFP